MRYDNNTRHSYSVLHEVFWPSYSTHCSSKVTYLLHNIASYIYVAMSVGFCYLPDPVADIDCLGGTL